MNYFTPVFLKSEAEYDNLNNKLKENTVYVTPFKYTLNRLYDTPLLLCNFSPNIHIFISGFFIPSEAFDYFNPLLVYKHEIKFYDVITKRYIVTGDINCMRIQSPALTNKLFSSLLKQIIYYPYGYTIYYSTYRVVNSSYTSDVIQFCDLLSKRIVSNILQESQVPGGLQGTGSLQRPRNFLESVRAGETQTYFQLPNMSTISNIPSSNFNSLTSTLAGLSTTNSGINSQLTSATFTLPHMIEVDNEQLINPLNLLNIISQTVPGHHPLYINSTSPRENDDDEDDDFSESGEFQQLEQPRLERLEQNHQEDQDDDSSDSNEGNDETSDEEENNESHDSSSGSGNSSSGSDSCHCNEDQNGNEE